jgi:flavin reductase (DIM6/NTAB) family NADH-FMN oxidoreductase RutF
MTAARSTEETVEEADLHRLSAALPLYRYFATTVALITSYLEGRGANVMACEWTMNVSYRPLRIMSLIQRGDYTHELITESGEFGVNLCSADQAAMSSYAGNTSGRDGRKLDAKIFAGCQYPAKKIKAPMLRGCVLNLECVVDQTFEIGDHTAFIGRAVAGRRSNGRQPLLYHQGRYFRLGEPVQRPVR